LPGEHIVEGRSTADTPSLLHDGKKLALSQEEQQLADIAFLKGIRVSVSVMNKLPTMGLLERVRNRIYGIMYLAQRKGDHVDFKQLGDVRLATVHAFVTTFTSTHNRYKALAQISTTTTYYDFEYGAREYVIDVSAPVDAFDKHAAEFSRIVRSFTFIEGR
jgi:hypothetical protein